MSTKSKNLGSDIYLSRGKLVHGSVVLAEQLHPSFVDAGMCTQLVVKNDSEYFEVFEVVRVKCWLVESVVCQNLKRLSDIRIQLSHLPGRDLVLSIEEGSGITATERMENWQGSRACLTKMRTNSIDASESEVSSHSKGHPQVKVRLDFFQKVILPHQGNNHICISSSDENFSGILRFLRTVPTKYKGFCARLGPCGKSRSFQWLLESKKKNGGSPAFLRDNQP